MHLPIIRVQSKACTGLILILLKLQEPILLRLEEVQALVFSYHTELSKLYTVCDVIKNVV